MKMLTFRKCLAAISALALPLTGAFGAVIIQTQPQSVAATEGTSVTLSVTAASDATPAKALTYQWFKAGGVTLLGSSRTLTFSSVKATDSGSYIVVIKESGEAATVDSDPATLTVNIKPRILTQPQSPLTPASEAGTASFSVTMNSASTAPFTYTWQRKVGSSYTTVANPNATVVGLPTDYTSQLSFTNLQLEDAGTYRVSITNITGTVVNSSDVVLKVNVRPKILVEPDALTNLALGATKTLKVTVGGNAPFTYQWFKNNVAIPGTNSASYTVRATAETPPGTPDLYRVEIFNPYSPGWANPLPPLETITKTISINAEVNVIRKPVIATHPTSPSTLSTVVDPINHTIQVIMAPTTNPGTYTYQWQKDRKNIVDQNNVDGPDPRVIAGTNTATLSFTPLSWLDRGSYRVIVKNEVGSITSKAVTVSLQSKPLIVRQSPSQVFGNVGGSIKLFVVAGGTPAGYKYAWFYRPLGGAFGTTPIGKSATLSLTKLAISRDGDYKCVVTTATGSVDSAVITLKVDVAPKITTQTAVVTTPPDNTYSTKSKVPVGGKVQLQVLAGTGTDSAENPLTYQWQKGRRNIVGATSRILELTNIQLSDTGKYRCIVRNFSGSATSNELTITVQNPPVITVQPTDILTNIEESKLESDVVRASGTATLKYKWEKQITAPGGGTAWSPVAGQTSSKLVIAKSDIDLHNGTYRCVVSNEVGSANSNEIDVEIQQIPVAELGPIVGLSAVGFYPPVARDGDLVRIFGNHMQYTTGVKFGETVVVPKVESQNAILVKVPADAPLTDTPMEVICKRGSASTTTGFRRTLDFENILANATIMPVTPGRYLLDGNNEYAAGQSALGEIWYEFSLPKNHRVTISCEGRQVGFQFVDPSIEIYEQQLSGATAGTFAGPDGVTRYRSVAIGRSINVGRIFERLFATIGNEAKRVILKMRSSLPPGRNMLPYGPIKLDVTISKLVITSSQTTKTPTQDDNPLKTSVLASGNLVENESSLPAIEGDNSSELRLTSQEILNNQGASLLWDLGRSIAEGYTEMDFSMTVEDETTSSDDAFGWQILDTQGQSVLAMWGNLSDGKVRFTLPDGSTVVSEMTLFSGDDFQTFRIKHHRSMQTLEVITGGASSGVTVNLPAGTELKEIVPAWDAGADRDLSKAAVIFRNFKVEHSVAP